MLFVEQLELKKCQIPAADWTQRVVQINAMNEFPTVGH